MFASAFRRGTLVALVCLAVGCEVAGDVESADVGAAGQNQTNALGHAVATSEAVNPGARATGTFVQTQVLDGVPEVLMETQDASGSYLLRQSWRIGLTSAANPQVLKVVARKTEATGDGFTFGWSVSWNGPFTPFCALGSADTAYKTCRAKVTLPAGTAAVYVQARDSIASRDRTSNRLAVDALALIPFDCSRCVAAECESASACSASEMECVAAPRPDGTACASGACLSGKCVAPAAAAKLIGEWRLDDGSGPAARDSSGAGADGILVGAPTRSAGRVGAALACHPDATHPTDAVRLPNTAALDAVQAGSFTLSAWYKADRVPANQDSGYNDYAHAIIAKRGKTVGIAYSFRQTFGFEHKLASGASEAIWGTTPYPPGSWHHVAAVLDRSAGAAKLYVDGRLEASGTFPAGSASWAYGASPWYLGTVDPAATTWRWDAAGSIDQARIFAGALSEAAVQDLFLEGAAPATVCGDGKLDAGEQCDQGEANGKAGSCCTVGCSLRPAGERCRDAAGECDALDACSGSSPHCPDEKKPAGAACSLGACQAGACVPAAATGRTFYVDSIAGSDGNPGIQAAPWKTVAKAGAAGLHGGDAVLFKRGATWSETLSPTSGSEGLAVVYGAYGTGASPVLGGFSANGKSWVRVEGVDFRSSGGSMLVSLLDSHHIRFSDCAMTYSGSAWAAVRLDGSSHNALVRCTIANQNTSSQCDTLSLTRGSGYNLVEGCTIKDGTHSTVSLAGADDKAPNAVQRYNVLRGNTIVSARGRPLEVMTLADWNLIEGNDIVGGTNTASTTGFCIGGQNFKMVTSHNIIRHNVMRDSAASSEAGLGIGVYQYGSFPANQAIGNRVYGNTLLNLARDPISIRTMSPGLCKAQSNVFKNNVVAYTAGARVLWVENQYEGVSDNHFEANDFYDDGSTAIVKVGTGSYGVAQVEAKLPAEFSKNLQVAPGLDADHRPAAGSPVLGAGLALTQVTSPSGSGSTLTVADSGYFSDGFGVVAGDRIRVGATVAQIQAIDHTAKRITLTGPIAWTQGAAVTLASEGTPPNVGAF